VQTKSFREFVSMAASEPLAVDVMPGINTIQPPRFDSCNTPIPMSVPWQAYLCNLGINNYAQLYVLLK
jgi:hypothetical protein